MISPGCRQLAHYGAGFAVWVCLAGALPAETIPVPNASFESPTTAYVSININSWQKAAKPDWYVEDSGFTWDQLTGAFRNPDPGSTDRIDNCDGTQAIWLFAVPEVSLFQDYDSMDWNDASPTHEFDATFEVGKAYTLTVGVIGGGGGMLPGASLQLGIYYRDQLGDRLTFASTSVVYSLTQFPTTTHLVDCQVQVPTVRADDPWAGRHIGLQFTSTVSTNLEGGYWDLDNVRLTARAAPELAGVLLTNGQFQLKVRSDPGQRVEILTATNAALPASNWVRLKVLTNLTGTATFTDTKSNLDQRFYRAYGLP